MITYSIIQKSQLEGANRLDAEYYQPEYLKYESIIKKIDCNNLSKVALIRSGFTPTDRDNFLKEGVVLLKTTDIRNDILYDKGDYYHISEKINDRMTRTKLKTNDILINIVGATLDVIGRVGLIPENFPDANITQAMALIRPINSSILSEYIFAFLNSKYGIFQTNRLARPTEQYNLNLTELGSFLIPLASLDNQLLVKSLINHACQEMQLSNNLYHESKNLLLEELGLKDYKVEENLSFVVNLSDVKSSHRADAEFFQPKYQKLINNLGKNLSPLKSIAKRKTKNIRINKDQDYKYIEISDIEVSNGESTYNMVNGKELPANAKMEITGGELIISKVRPTRGAVSIIPEDWKENFIASGAFSIYEASSPTKEYLQVVLRSIIGKIQLEKPNTGTSYPTVTDEDVENIIIPILPKETQQKIADLVKKSHEARKKSKQFLAEAKRKVEEMIEKGEKNV